MRLGVLNWLSSLVVVVCTFTSPASPETIVPTGNVSGNWTIEGSPYIVSGGTITIPNGQRLKIESGVRVEFTGRYKFIVNGHLLAGGLPGDSIVFTYTGPDSISGWRGFRLNGADSTVFSYCRFEGGRAVLGSGSDSTGGVAYISTAGTVVEFNNCEFTNNYAGSSGGAVFAGPNTSVLCRDCLFHKNFANGDGGAVFVNNAHGSIFERCEFRHNFSNKGGGALFNRYANATYIDCRFYDNTAHSSGGSLVVTGPPSFRRCVFEGNTTQIAQGGAVYLYDSTTTASFDSCSFYRNKSLLRDAGGAYCWESSPHFTDCQFIGNYSADDGGAVHTYRSGANPVFLRCLFEHNESSDEGGGLIISRYSRATLTDCVIRNNRAAGRGGGGLYFRLLAEPTITNCVIEENYSEYGGGGVHINAANPAIVNCSIRGNESDTTGGGLFSDGATFSLVECIIENNHASKHGGGLALLNSSPDISRCRIEGNHADELGGGIYLLDSATPFTNCLIAGNSASEQGGAIYAENSYPEILHCTIANNRAESGHSIYSTQSSGNILDCVFSNRFEHSNENVGPNGTGFECAGTSWEIRNSLFHNLGNPEFAGPFPVSYGALAALTAAGDSCDGYGNLFMDPVFDTSSPDEFTLCTNIEISPAVNSAAPTAISTDLIGHNRYTNATGLPDMGCYEATRAENMQTEVWGIMEGTITAGEYRVYGDIIVPNGSKLTLEPGVTLNFMGPFAILVYGVFECHGAESDSVRLYSNSVENILAWRGIRFAGSGEASVLTFTQIENCIASLGDSSGGGAGVFAGATPEFTDCRIVNCSTSGAGGGLRVVDGSVTMNNCLIENCTAGTGGGIRIGTAQHATLVGCQLRGCNATSGGGISTESSTLEMVLTSCVGNSASDGAALYVRNSLISLAYCALDSNNADQSGGAMFTSGSEIGADSLLLRANTALYGAGVYAIGLEGLIERAQFVENFAESEGGGVYLDQSEVTFARCLFALNSAEQGGAIQLIHDSSSFLRCTIVGNTAGIGGGFYFENSETHVSSSQVLGNESGYYFANSSAAFIEYCNSFDNRVGDYIFLNGDPLHAPAQLGQTGYRNRLNSRCDVFFNVWEDPLFIDEDGGNYELADNSPSQDAASPDFPCDDDLTFADIGAFYAPHESNMWIPEHLTPTILESGEMQLHWNRPDLRRVCNQNLLWYQIEMTDSIGAWQAIALVPDTTFVLALPESTYHAGELRVRSRVIE